MKLREHISCRISEFRLSLMLLTRLPVWHDDASPLMGRAAWAYPVAGLIVGGIAAMTLWVAGWLGLPTPAGVTLGLAALILTTGGLHEDGLADTADGFGGGATKDRKLEIMRDSRIGSYGVIAIALSLMLRAAGLWSLALVGGAAQALIVAAVLSRSTLPLTMTLLPPARSEGLGRSASGVSQAGWVAALALGVLAALSLGVWTFLCLSIVTGLVTLLIWRISRRQIGGYTGDTLGAQQQLTEIAVLLTLSAA